MVDHSEIVDWSECELVETHPDILGGSPALVGTRMPVDTIVDNFDYGVSVSEISEQWELEPSLIEAVLAYAKSHRVAHRIR